MRRIFIGRAQIGNEIALGWRGGEGRGEGGHNVAKQNTLYSIYRTRHCVLHCVKLRAGLASASGRSASRCVSLRRQSSVLRQRNGNGLKTRAYTPPHARLTHVFRMATRQDGYSATLRTGSHLRLPTNSAPRRGTRIYMGATHSTHEREREREEGEAGARSPAQAARHRASSARDVYIACPIVARNQLGARVPSSTVVYMASTALG